MMKDSSQTLLIIPCCARKKPGGGSWSEQPKTKMFGDDIANTINRARMQVLKKISSGGPRYQDDKYLKNLVIKPGPDFGGRDDSGLYMSAIDRYIGSLYTVYPVLFRLVRQRLQDDKNPHILILSALYGPLHPLDYIQDYNLEMGDIAASRTWSDIFPLFLQQYIKITRINRIELYLGAKTPYYRVAKRAISPLLQSGRIQEAILHEVQNGSMSETPKNHGLLLARHLGAASTKTMTREIIERNIC